MRERAFPLEIYGEGPPYRKVLTLEIWLAALQEPEAVFKPFNDDWPTTTLPAFEGAWRAYQQDETIGWDFDLRLREAFFSEGRNIGRREVILEPALEADLDMDHFTRLFESDQPRIADLEEGCLGKEIYKVMVPPRSCWLTVRKCATPLLIHILKMERSDRSVSCHVIARAAMKPRVPYLNKL